LVEGRRRGGFQHGARHAHFIAHVHGGAGLHHIQGIGGSGVAIGSIGGFLHVKARRVQVGVHARHDCLNGVRARGGHPARALDSADMRNASRRWYARR